MFNRKHPPVQHVENSDMIDLLLDADETTRRQLMSQAIQSGALDKSEADDLIAQVSRLERAAGPRLSGPKPEPPAPPAWGIDYP